jgi:hypothetical protein
MPSAGLVIMGLFIGLFSFFLFSNVGFGFGVCLGVLFV